LVDRNNVKGRRSVVVLSLGPSEESLNFYTNRYGPPAMFLNTVQEVILREMEEADDQAMHMQVSPRNVIQMGVYFGIEQREIVEESYLLGVALCALFAPLPPFWHMVGFDDSNGNGSTDGGRESPTTIDFKMTNEGKTSTFRKMNKDTETLRTETLLFARDQVGEKKHTQAEHPSDEYWKLVFEESRKVSERASDRFS